MIVFPLMVGNIRAIRMVLQVPLMFLFAGLEASSGFSCVVPRTGFTWNFLNNNALKIRGLSKLWTREFLLKGFEWFVDNTDIIFASKPAKRNMAKYGIMLMVSRFPYSCVLRERRQYHAVLPCHFLRAAIGSKIVIDIATLSWVAHVRIKFDMFCQKTSL